MALLAPAVLLFFLLEDGGTIPFPIREGTGGLRDGEPDESFLMLLAVAEGSPK